jgi:hypothetical protein
MGMLIQPTEQEPQASTTLIPSQQLIGVPCNEQVYEFYKTRRNRVLGSLNDIFSGWPGLTMKSDFPASIHRRAPLSTASSHGILFARSSPQEQVLAMATLIALHAKPVANAYFQIRPTNISPAMHEEHMLEGRCKSWIDELANMMTQQATTNTIFGCQRNFDNRELAESVVTHALHYWMRIGLNDPPHTPLTEVHDEVIYIKLRELQLDYAGSSPLVRLRMIQLDRTEKLMREATVYHICQWVHTKLQAQDLEPVYGGVHMGDEVLVG